MKQFLLCTAIALVAAMPVSRLDAHDHTDGWMPLPVGGDTIGKGSTEEHPTRYYLTADTRLEKDLVVTDNAVVTLCLNGYQLTGTGQNPVIRVSSAHFTVCDCREGVMPRSTSTRIIRMPTGCSCSMTARTSGTASTRLPTTPA